MENKQSKLSILTRGIIKENPVLVLILGTCPTLATTTGAINGLGMGVSTMVVLICSNIIISLLKNIIPDKVRIPCYIVVIATFVTIVQLMLKAFLPELDSALGRAEMFASKNSVVDSALDGIGMGLGFTLALFFMGAARELLGAGTLFGITLTANIIEPMAVLKLAPGGFFVFGILVAIVNKLTNGKASKNAENGCMKCACSSVCGHVGGCTPTCEEELLQAIEDAKVADEINMDEEGGAL